MDLLAFRKQEAQIYFNLMTAQTTYNKAKYIKAYINHYFTQSGQELYLNTYISRDFIEYLLANFAQQSQLALPIIQAYQKQFDPHFEPKLISSFSLFPPNELILKLVQEFTYVIQNRLDRQELLGKAMNLSEFLMSPIGQNYLQKSNPQLKSDIHQLYQNLINQNYLIEIGPYYEPIFHPSQHQKKMQKFVNLI